MAITIRNDGGIDLGRNAETVGYSILPDEDGATILRRGTPWRSDDGHRNFASEWE